MRDARTVLLVIEERFSGAALRALREERGWSREDLAAQLGYEKLSSGAQAISRWEGARTMPTSPKYREAIRLLTGAEVATILELVDERLERIEALLVASTDETERAIASLRRVTGHSRGLTERDDETIEERKRGTQGRR